MMLHWADTGWLASWSAALTRGAFEGGIFVLAVWATCRLGWRLPAWLRAALWWTASLKLLLAAFPIAPVELALHPSPAARALAAATHPGDWPAAISSRVAAGRASETRPSSASMPAQRDPAGLATWLGLLALVGILARVGFAARDHIAIRRVFRGARVLDDEALGGWLARQGNMRVTMLVTDAIEVPVVAGLWRPRVLIPESALRMPRAELHLALAHELGHLRRGDLWMGLVPAVMEAVFWFHPLAWLAAREYVQAREEACDASAVHLCRTPTGDYAELLLAMGVAHPRLAALAARCGPTDSRQLKRRLLMLHHLQVWTRTQRLAAVVALALIAAVAMLPLRVVAASSSKAAPSTPAPKTGTTKSTSKSKSTVTTSGTSHITRTEETSDGSTSYSYSTSDEDYGAERLSYVLVEEDGHSFTGAGEEGDWDRVSDLGNRHQGACLYLRIDADRYLVTDPEVLEQVRALTAPQRELGRKQSELGARQGELGRKQGELGRKQGELGGMQADLAGKQAMVAARRSSSRLDEATERELADLEREIASQMREIGRRQSELGQLQSELGGKQSELGAVQSKLGQEQRRLSAEVFHHMESLARDLVKTGKAKPLTN